MLKNTIKVQLNNNLPHKSGVYIFKGESNEILYVGKAIDLKTRVSQYYSSSQKDQKTLILVEKIKSLDTIIVESELEALILEANLIKKYLPPFNIRLIDDKNYLYIIITKEDYPKIITGRIKDLKIANKYFGPFPSSKTAKNTLKQLRKIFPWCNNPFGEKPCFYYHLNLCPGPCTGKINIKDCKKIISRFIKFMEGKKGELIKELTKEMGELSSNQKFEEADIVKKTIEGITYITQSNRTEMYLENPNFLEQENEAALEALKKDLNLDKLPERIEGYDISNIQGQQATGSMVVLTHGEIDKSQYRKFKIKITGKPNDVGMHKEMMRRRLNHPEWGMPDLIIVDGGIAQAKAVSNKIPVFGLAKRLEWLYSPSGEVIKLSRSSLSLKLIQKLRDEAHRFAVSYHKKLRSVNMYK